MIKVRFLEAFIFISRGKGFSMMPKGFRFFELAAVFLVCLGLFVVFPQQRSAHAAARQLPSASTCIAPPANFDPLQATNQTLFSFGLPARPQNTSDISEWLEAVSSAKHRVCTSINTSQLSHPVTHQSNRGIVNNASGTLTSSNWSGYYASGTSFDAVTGEWFVPCATPVNPGSHAISWVGLGGWFGNQNLWQGGTINDPTWGISLWWEAWPNNNIQVVSTVTLSCNDHIYAFADYNRTAPGANYIYLQDVTTGAFFSTTYTNGFVPNLSSADWIDERPTCNGGYSQLANFNIVNWFYSQAEINFTGMRDLATFPNQAITMVDIKGTVLSIPSPIASDGQSFTETWQNFGVGTLCP
jgi:hypothetical protein